ncbi:hypothetical protein CYY_001110 [Polysphondylium violaceum]|uniref:Armadillo-like helical domain-containing protein n=1 Tax=Polysphondylium violaceum TaxID=133409 RepID=A0A8J4Q2D9_9MYCE|nr:hypothetical protein CYY_001110 [Polysphondylium violaceum]
MEHQHHQQNNSHINQFSSSSFSSSLMIPNENGIKVSIGILKEIENKEIEKRCNLSLLINILDQNPQLLSNYVYQILPILLNLLQSNDHEIVLNTFIVFEIIAIHFNPLPNEIFVQMVHQFPTLEQLSLHNDEKIQFSALTTFYFLALNYSKSIVVSKSNIVDILIQQIKQSKDIHILQVITCLLCTLLKCDPYDMDDQNVSMQVIDKLMDGDAYIYLNQVIIDLLNNAYDSNGSDGTTTELLENISNIIHYTLFLILVHENINREKSVKIYNDLINQQFIDSICKLFTQTTTTNENLLNSSLHSISIFQIIMVIHFYPKDKFSNPLRLRIIKDRNIINQLKLIKTDSTNQEHKKISLELLKSLTLNKIEPFFYLFVLNHFK